jgi:DNA-directed RNA polymerase subunit RPC12/RpoP
LSFVAHSVGELTLSAWTVAVDVDEAAARPPVPAGGLSLPRPPATVPGEAHDSYCATCEGEHGTTEDAGVACCANCGARVLLPGRTGAAAAAGAVLHVRRP